MSDVELPHGWAQTEISEILVPQITGKPFQQGWSPQCLPQPAEDGAWGVLKTTAIQESEFWPHQNKALPASLDPKPNIEIKPGDVLMTCAGPRNRCGVACYVKEVRPGLMMSGKMYRFRPDVRAVEAMYLMHFLTAHDSQVKIDRMKTGINDSGLNLTHDRFSAFPIIVPPLPEQKRIVAKIEELFIKLDKGNESLRDAQAQLKLYRQSLLKHAFEGKLTEDWRAANTDKLDTPDNLLARIKSEREAQYNQDLALWKRDVAAWDSSGQKGKKPQKPRLQSQVEIQDGAFDEFASLPVQWKWVVLNDLTKQISDGTHKTPKYKSEGIHFVSAKDINKFKIDLTNTRFIAQSEHEEISNRCNVQFGNILITKSGTIGRIARVETETPISLFESVANVPPIAPIDGRFLMFCCFHMLDSYYISRHRKGVAVGHLHLEDLRRLPIPLCGEEEQIEIAERLSSQFSSLDAIELEIETQLAKADALRQSILKQAFSGKLVPQDPNDEPASVLLERIRAERAGTKPPKRQTRPRKAKEAA
jgi:type I restriction enzyme S subunit